jgi:hypothetical protein
VPENLVALPVQREKQPLGGAVHDEEQAAPMTGLVSVNEDPGRLSATPDGGPRVTSVDVAGMPWAFTQYEPLSTGEFISQADRRGFHLDTGRLRQLYRRGVLVPFVYMTSRPVSPEPALAGPEPRGGGTSLLQLRYARDRGRLVDLDLQPFRPPQPKRSSGPAPGWPLRVVPVNQGRGFGAVWCGNAVAGMVCLLRRRVS